jgi:uncharacterized protein (DUF1501 family)
MPITRRQFVKNGVSAFTLGFAAPAFLCDAARAQGATGRTLVVLYLSGGNDAISTLVPYNDPHYYDRRPALAIPAGTVLQVGTDSAGNALGLHPRLRGLHAIFNSGRLAIVQRTGYLNSTRSHFLGTDIWSTANPANAAGPGWLGRYLDAIPAPVDPLAAWTTTRETPHTLETRRTSVAAIPDPRTYVFNSPNGSTSADAQHARTAATRIASHLPIERPHLAYVNATAQAAFATMDRVVPVTQYVSTVTYPNNGFGQALRAIAGAMVKGVGTKIFWLQTGGYDTHGTQGTTSGTYNNLMATLDDGLIAFYTDLQNQGLLSQTLILQFSEFARRINQNASGGCDHGAAGLMMAIGGSVNGGLYGTAASLNPDPNNPTLENGAQDIRYETDFRSVYARVLDGWLGADSVSILGADFRNASLKFI